MADSFWTINDLIPIQDTGSVTVSAACESVVLCRKLRPREFRCVSPERARYNSPGQRPGTLAPCTKTKALKGRT